MVRIFLATTLALRGVSGPSRFVMRHLFHFRNPWLTMARAMPRTRDSLTTTSSRHDNEDKRETAATMAVATTANAGSAWRWRCNLSRPARLGERFGARATLSFSTIAMIAMTLRHARNLPLLDGNGTMCHGHEAFLTTEDLTLEKRQLRWIYPREALCVVSRAWKPRPPA